MYVGDLIKFGASTRMYIVCGAPEQSRPEADVTDRLGSGVKHTSHTHTHITHIHTYIYIYIYIYITHTHTHTHTHTYTHISHTHASHTHIK